MWSKICASKRAKGLLITIGVLLVVFCAVAIGFFGFFLPYSEAENTMDPAATVTITQQEDDTLLVQWPAGVNADSYTLQVILDGGVVFTDTTTDTSCVLPKLPTKEIYTLRIDSACHYNNTLRMGTRSLVVTTALEPPTVKNPEWTVDALTQTLYLNSPMESGDSCMVYVGDDAQLLGALKADGISLSYGENGDFTMPEYGENRVIWFELTTLRDRVCFQGKRAVGLELSREDFLGTGLHLTYEELPSNAYKLTWNETKGDHYEIHICLDGRTWSLLDTVAKGAPLEYTTDYLPPFMELQLRVSAVGGQTMPGSDYAAEPAVVTLQTKQRTIYATMWAVNDQKVYADPQKTQQLGKISGGVAYCILEETDGMFGIRFNGGVGYVDSNYCMINLPEYLAEICAYDITNSYSSLYMVHEFGIDQVSGTIIKGYEKIDLGGGDFVVPLLYPSAVKLVNAALAAMEQGYRIKIYDSYRPNAATLDIYNKAELILQNPVPKNTFSGKVIQDLGLLKFTPGLPQTPSTDPTDPTATTTEPQVWDGILEGLTYEILMTDNGRWLLANFLAKGGSNHNKGIALDMTLVDAQGNDLPMQTSMHDLSWYSEAARNNGNANLMRKIMTENGFGGLTSEWWHFQDNDARDKLSPPSLYGGVSLRCWMKDSVGWRYRTETGECLRDCTKKIDGITYVFDENGYATEAE